MSDNAKPAAPASRVKQYIDAGQMRIDTGYNPVDIEEAMDRQSGLFAYYAELHAKSMQQEADLKLRLEVIEAKTYMRYRDQAAETGAKTTEALLGHQVTMDPLVIRAKKELNEAKAVATLAKDTLEALKQRRDMLIQRGVGMREERKGEVFVKTQEAAEASERARRQRALELAGRRTGTD